eukprot:2506754-Rhodomonas_salina.1
MSRLMRGGGRLRNTLWLLAFNFLGFWAQESGSFMFLTMRTRPPDVNQIEHSFEVWGQLYGLIAWVYVDMVDDGGFFSTADYRRIRSWAVLFGFFAGGRGGSAGAVRQLWDSPFSDGANRYQRVGRACQSRHVHS